MREVLPGRLARRLALSFGAVAIAALALTAVTALLAVNRQSTRLVQRQQTSASAVITDDLETAYRSAGGWQHADLRIAYSDALAAGAVLDVRDQHGQLVRRPQTNLERSIAQARARSAGDATLGPTVTLTLRSGAAGQVGSTAIRFFGGALPTTERSMRNAITRTTIIGVGLSILLVLAAGLLLARRLTRPLRRLTRTAAAMRSGDLDARAPEPIRDDELRELTIAFNQMAESVAVEHERRRRLAGDVAHELRTPLAILRATCEDLMQTNGQTSKPQPIERIATLHDEVLRLERVVEDLDTLRAREPKSLALKLTAADLADAASAAVELLAPRFAEAAVTLELDAASAPVHADPARLRQIVINLLANALKFTTANDHVTVRTTIRDGTASLEVTDTGPGIADEELGAVFERARRGRNARATAGGGLGLSIVKQLAEAQGGHAEAHNQPDGGAVIRITFPHAPPTLLRRQIAHLSAQAISWSPSTCKRSECSRWGLAAWASQRRRSRVAARRARAGPGALSPFPGPSRNHLTTSINPCI